MTATEKKCSKCGEVKTLDQYDKHKGCKYGVCSYCKACDRAATKAWRESNREKLRACKARHYQENKQEISEKKKIRYRQKRDSILAQKKDYYLKNRDRLTAKMRAYYHSRKGLPEACRNEYFNRRRKEDPMFDMKQRVRTRIYHAMRVGGWSKNAKTTQMLGCEWPELKKHIESQFTSGMSWDNRSEWHIDHIIPLSSASTEQEILDLCHFTNLQPLWAGDNIRKGSKLPANPTPQGLFKEDLL